MNERAYIYGNAVRKEETVQPVASPSPSYYIRRQHAPRPERIPYVRRANIGYLLFLIAAVAAAGVMLTGYISLRSRLLNGTRNIAVLETRLNNLRQENDEAYTRALGGVDLEEIRRIAIGEYGMRYANEGQIVGYDTEGGSDYVRQFAEIP